MPKPLKTPRVTIPDRKGVFGQRGKALRVAIYARVATHDQKTLPMHVAAAVPTEPFPARARNCADDPRGVHPADPVVARTDKEW